MECMKSSLATHTILLDHLILSVPTLRYQMRKLQKSFRILLVITELSPPLYIERNPPPTSPLLPHNFHLEHRKFGMCCQHK
jgi:hypothetical protein